jgi:predicted permease
LSSRSAIAAYSSVPVFLASPLLASPTLTILVIAAFFHSCVLCSLGLRRLLGCRSEDAAMYVAATGFVSGVAGLILGGLSGAAGIL